MSMSLTSRIQLKGCSQLSGQVKAKYIIDRIEIFWQFFVKRWEKYQRLREYIIQISEISILRKSINRPST